MQAQYGAGDGEADSRRAAAGSGDAGLYFLGPLHELVAIGLHRPALDALCAGPGEGGPPREPLIDRAYLLKMLDEEVMRQFGHPLRPIIELVLNAADAVRGTQPVVEIAVEDGRVEVRDAGEGMGLRAILSRLLIPFATDKQPGIDLGRFGVGFFSVLGFGLVHPESFALNLTTGDGAEGWSIRVVAWPLQDPDEGPSSEERPLSRPSSRGEQTAALMCSVRRIAPVVGTRVRVASALLEQAPVRAYLRDALHFFPPQRALVRLDGATLNDGRLIAGGQLIEERIALREGAPASASGAPSSSAPPPIGGRARAPLAARFHLGGRGLLHGIAAATFHGGVKVEACLAISELSLIDFPAAVELTEGRDALKVGPAFVAVATAFHRRLIRIAVERGADRPTRDRLAEVAAQISALMLQSAGWDEVARELSRALLGPGRCMVSPERREGLLGFLGPSVAERLFVPESFWAEREWHPHLPGERELLEDELDIDPPETLAALARRRVDLGGLSVFTARATSPQTLMVALCRGRLQPEAGPTFGDPGAVRLPQRRIAARGATPRRPPGPLPCLGTRRLMLIRDDSAALRRPAGWCDWYALRAAFDRASGVRESDLERDLIVGEALGVEPRCTANQPKSSGGER